MSGNAIAELVPRSASQSDTSRRMLVTVRPNSDASSGPRPYTHVGFLSQGPDGYSFEYVQPAPPVHPLIGFPRLDQRYQSPELFPLFAERIISARRPDRASYLAALDLSEDSEPWEILQRSGGRRAGDTIEVLPEPTVSDTGATCCVFLVHGVRHQGFEASEAIDRLQIGNRLTLLWEPTNPVNRRAVLVLSDTGVAVGYVPDPLVEYVHRVLERDDYTLTVQRANGPEVGSHLRLLVRLDGVLPVGYRPF